MRAASSSAPRASRVPRSASQATPRWRRPSDRKSTRLNSSHRCISYAVFCLKKKEQKYSGHDLGGADDMSVKRLGVHVTVADGGQRLHTEEKAVEEPMSRRSGDTVLPKAVKG